MADSSFKLLVLFSAISPVSSGPKSKYWKCTHCGDAVSFAQESHQPAVCRRCGSPYYDKMVIV